jgi:hypothetical protein
MSINIPIVTDFDGKGVKKALAQFKQLETTGAKAQFALKKAAVPAAAALGGLVAIMGDATKGAMEDAAAQAELARQLEFSAGATTSQIKAAEDWISTQGRLLGVTDDELRPALAALSRVTYDVEEAQKGVSLAMDIAAATGKPLEAVTNALAKAYGGNTAALAKLDPSLRDMIKGGATLDEVFFSLDSTFSGAAATAANTAEGGFKRLSVSLNEAKESVGAALLPVIEKALPKLIEFGNWAQNNTDVILAIGGAIGAMAAATVALNAAMAVNPYVALAAGIIALAKGFETLADKVSPRVERVMNLIGSQFMVPQLIKFFDAISGGRFSNDKKAGSTGGGGGRGLAIPAMAQGGIVTSPTLALIGEAGPEAVVPLSKMGQMGGGIHVTVTSANPDAVVEAIVEWSKRNGALPGSVRVA